MTKFDYEILVMLCNQNVDNPLKAYEYFADTRIYRKKKII